MAPDWFSIPESRELLRCIFPNYPELEPCWPAPPDLMVFLKWVRNELVRPVSS